MSRRDNKEQCASAYVGRDYTTRRPFGQRVFLDLPIRGIRKLSIRGDALCAKSELAKAKLLAEGLRVEVRPVGRAVSLLSSTPSS